MKNLPSLSYIPGFGHNWTVPTGEEHRFLPNMYRQYTHNSTALQYVRWGIKDTVPKNPLESFQKYAQEEHQSKSLSSYSILKEHLSIHQPEVIVAHSMGARALYHAVEKGLYLPNVKKIILLQPDIPLGYDVSEFAHQIHSQNIHLSHTWCPWDDLLGIMSIYTGELRLGQLPHPEKLIRSHFFSLKFTISKWCHTQVLEQNINHMIV